MTKFLLAVLLSLSLSGCSIGYIMRGAYEEGKLVVTREKIETLLKDESLDPILKEKLTLVLDAREYAISMGLNPGKSFTRYAKLDRDVFAWVVLGSKPDAFELNTWWFPIVGSVPYKGFFEEEDAEAEAKWLEAKGFETWVRSTDAMSTLGWFIDPILSSTLTNDDVEIVNTVIHESLHSTIWIKHNVEFNETLANFIGLSGTVSFYKNKLDLCGISDNACREKYDLFHKQAELQYQRAFEFAVALDFLYKELSALYSSSLPKDEKLLKRAETFKRAIAPLDGRFPKRKVLISVNNAEIMQLKLYMTDLPKFAEAFEKSGSSFDQFLALMRDIEKEDGEPFEILKGKLSVR